MKPVISLLTLPLQVPPSLSTIIVKLTNLFSLCIEFIKIMHTILWTKYFLLFFIRLWKDEHGCYLIITHVGFFKKHGVDRMPDDVRRAYEKGDLNIQPQATNRSWGRKRSEGREGRSRSPHGTAEAEDSDAKPEAADAMDTEDTGRNAAEAARAKQKKTCVVRGPYLEPEEPGGKHKHLRLEGEYEYSMDIEQSRKDFEQQMARQVPSPTNAETNIVSSKERLEWLKSYLLAIHQYRSEWACFPDLGEYLWNLESGEELEMEE